jgi:hypothetical protein
VPDRIGSSASDLACGREARPAVTSIALAFLIGALMIVATGATRPSRPTRRCSRGRSAARGCATRSPGACRSWRWGSPSPSPSGPGSSTSAAKDSWSSAGLAGTLVAIHLDGPSFMVITASLVVGAAAGAAWAALAAFGQVGLQLPILITSLLLNYPARALTGYLVRFQFADPTVTSSSTVPVPPAGTDPQAAALRGCQRDRHRGARARRADRGPQPQHRVRVRDRDDRHQLPVLALRRGRGPPPDRLGHADRAARSPGSPAPTSSPARSCGSSTATSSPAGSPGPGSS